DAEREHIPPDGEVEGGDYLLGNSAHWHNPRGFPSIAKPELTSLLNFLPNGKDGGVFEFPFERYSPVRSRGAAGDIAIPYITPSLRDYPVAAFPYRLDNGQDVVNDGITWTPKYHPIYPPG